MARKKTGPDFSNLATTYMEAEKVLTEYESGKSTDLTRVSRIKEKLESAIDLNLAVLVDLNKDMRLPIVGLLSGLYRFLGGAHMYLEEYGPAKECYESAQYMGKEIGMSAEIVQALNNLGIIALKQSNPVEARKYFKQSIEYLDRETESQFGKAIRKNLAHTESLISR